MSDSEDDVVIDLREEKRDDNLKELLIWMEKMEGRQVQIDKKLDSLAM